MKHLTYILLAMMVLMMSCQVQDNFIRTSNEIYKRTLRGMSNDTIYFIKARTYLNKKRVHRNEIFSNGMMPFFTTSEPLFIIEGFDLETGYTYVEIWNSKGYVSYFGNLNYYQVDQEGIYSVDLKSLIANWDTKSISINEKKSKLFGALDIYARKVAFNSNGKIEEIKSFSFEQYDGCMKQVILIDN